MFIYAFQNSAYEDNIMKTIIAGSRDVTDYEYVTQACRDCGWEITSVVSGTAKGVDILGERYAEENGLPLFRFPADWTRYGKRAGYIRNSKMASVADALVAVWDGSSRGTEHMINIAKETGLKVYVKIVPV
jgi:hypothetical protein